MDLKGLERAAERSTYPYRDKEKLFKEEFLGYAERLRRIKNAYCKNNFERFPVNIADVVDPTLGEGRVSARVFEFRSTDEDRRPLNQFRIEYFFTPSTPRQPWHDQGWPEEIHIEQFRISSPIEDQLDAMLSTVEMLETAIMTEGLDNETLRERYEARAGWEL